MSDKKYWNRGAFMTEVDNMVVVDEQHLDEQVSDVKMRERMRKQLEVKLPVETFITSMMGDAEIST